MTRLTDHLEYTRSKLAGDDLSPHEWCYYAALEAALLLAQKGAEVTEDDLCLLAVGVGYPVQQVIVQGQHGRVYRVLIVHTPHGFAVHPETPLYL